MTGIVWLCQNFLYLRGFLILGADIALKIPLLEFFQTKYYIEIRIWIHSIVDEERHPHMHYRTWINDTDLEYQITLNNCIMQTCTKRQCLDQDIITHVTVTIK